MTAVHEEVSGSHASPLPEPKKHSRGSADERRIQLMQATIHCIAEQGLSNITLNSVATQAGLTAGLINFHFKTKQTLLTSTLEHVANDYETACRQVMDNVDLDASERLQQMVRVSFDERYCSVENAAVWYSFWGEAKSRQDYVAICSRSEDFLLNSSCALIENLAKKEDRDVNVLAAAKGLCGLIDVLWQELLVQRDAFDRVAAVKTCFAYLENLLPGAFEKTGSIRTQSEPVCLRSKEDGLAQTLPAAAYCDAQYFATEMERIHLPAWQVVCHVSDIPDTGDYFAFEGLGKTAFVVRQEDGAVAGFHNVCPHRAHELVSGQGKCDKLIRCPYHAWGFDLTGNLKAIAAKKAFPPFDSGAFGLKPVDCEVFLGFVFIRFAPGGASVATRFSPHKDELSHYNFEQMLPLYAATTEVVDANWKNVWDNYLEDYHFPTGHPGLFGLMGMKYDRQPDDRSRTIRLSHEMREQPKGWANQIYARQLPDQSHLPEQLKRRWSYFMMYPGLSFDVYPDLIDFFHVLPLAPGRSLLRYAAYGLPAEGDRRMGIVRKLNMRINRQVGAEDTALIESVQKGLESGHYQTGLLGEKEHAVRAFQKWVQSDMEG